MPRKSIRPDLSDEEFTNLLLNTMEQVKGESLPEEKKKELREIVEEEREGIEQWALEGFLRKIKREK